MAPNQSYTLTSDYRNKQTISFGLPHFNKLFRLNITSFFFKRLYRHVAVIVQQANSGYGFLSLLSPNSKVVKLCTSETSKLKMASCLVCVHVCVFNFSDFDWRKIVHRPNCVFLCISMMQK